MAIQPAIELAPGEASYVIQLAGIVRRQGRREEDLALYRQAMQMKGAQRCPEETRMKSGRLT